MKTLSSLPPSDTVTGRSFLLAALSLDEASTPLYTTSTPLDVASISLDEVSTRLDEVSIYIDEAPTLIDVTSIAIDVVSTRLDATSTPIYEGSIRLDVASKQWGQAFLAPSACPGGSFLHTQFFVEPFFINYIIKLR